MLLSTTTEDPHAKRWREWQLKNEHQEQKQARRARLVFTVMFIAVGVWLAFQLR